jgi:mannose/fructose/N-acetylgalactosamine-specific phosphotransferase system component IIC
MRVVFPLPPGGLSHLAALAGAAGLVAGLAAVERKGAFQLMVSRPLVLAPLMGLALGDLQGGLLLGVPLELLFLGGVNLGGAVPENETLLSAALASAVLPAGIATGRGADPAVCALGLLLLAPLALIGRWLDRTGETRAVALVGRARVLTALGDPDPARIQLRGLYWPLLTTGAICVLCVFASPLLAEMRNRCGAHTLVGLEGSWHAAQALSVAAAIRAIREPRALWLAAIAALAVFGAALLMRVHG